MMNTEQAGYWWLSFATEESNLGICIIEADSFLDAIQQSHELGCNPGGEVKGCLMPDNEEGREEIEKWGTNKLISKKELVGEGYKSALDKQLN